MINIDERIHEIFKETCGTFQKCNESSIVSFLSECWKHSIDPQYAIDWLEQYKVQMAHWPEFVDKAHEWVTEHTSSGSPFTTDE
ncbi:hypothetical protein [Bacillus alkalicellulosilyticus]|uniref:hypothetical protein n=1 Tax=Alkalihalobacterium alkalicellulosilyticum TaxID=1912214 RepID=UPI00099667FE|nr:hypothetical protein [Bacillus alkalicellulosilyticus]